MDTPRLLNVAQAADLVGVSSRTLRRYFYDGRLQGTRVGPKLLRFAVADLEALFVKGSGK